MRLGVALNELMVRLDVVSEPEGPQRELATVGKASPTIFWLRMSVSQ